MAGSVNFHATDEGPGFQSEFESAYASALAKFDSLPALFANSLSVPKIAADIMTEILSDAEFATCFASRSFPEKELTSIVKSRVGAAYGTWKKENITTVATSHQHLPQTNPLRWASIDAYPDWIMSQMHKLFNAELHEYDAIRHELERTILEQPVHSASLKYDGTCFGKRDDGTLMGRNSTQMPGVYHHTSTSEVESCDVAAFKRELERITDTELSAICVYGELMCNPGFYGYSEQGLAGAWLAFGAVAKTSITATEQVSAALTMNGLAHSVNDCFVRLLFCPALRRLLEGVAGCQTVRVPVAEGMTHASAVERGAALLVSGDNEGLVLVFDGHGGRSSVRKWKNSSEGSGVSKRHALELRACEVTAARLSSEGSLDARIVRMLTTLRQVAEADTRPVKLPRAGVRKGKRGSA